MAYSVTHNSDDARDVVQRVFLNLLQRRDLSEVDRNAEGFLYRAAMNEALHVLRSRRRQAQVIAGDLDSVEDVVDTVHSSIEDRARQDLEDALARLKPEEVDIVLLRYEQGYSNGEIAEILGQSQIHVAVNLFRARAHLKKRLRAKLTRQKATGRPRQTLQTQLSTEGERS